MQRLTSLLCLLLICLAGAPAAAHDDTPARRQVEWVAQTITRRPVEAAAAIYERAGPAFRAALTERALANSLVQIKLSWIGDGPLTIERYDTGETDTNVTALARSEDTGAPCLILLATDPTGEQIIGLRLMPVAVPGKLGVKTWQDLDSHLDALQGVASLAAMRLHDGAPQPVHLYHSGERLAIGSSFKLYVLGALAELVAEGAADWDDQLAIEDRLKSLPSGTMQNEPAGTTHSLAQFANAMISISDNTATDHLIHRVGRDRIETYLRAHQEEPERSIPFLSTREMFVIKIGTDKTLPDRYLAATIDERRAMLDGPVAEGAIDYFAVSIWSTPRHIDDIEWFATTPELCAVMADLHRHEQSQPEVGAALRINPGLPCMKADWPSVAYKGGSEPGVLNLTWLLQRNDGAFYTLSITWNDPTAKIDEATLLDIAAEAIGLLHQHDRRPDAP
jgi:hypothetical protein